MARRPKDIGTAAETAVVRFLLDNGFPHAERRSLRGSVDHGDITGMPGVMVEVKGGQAGKNASDTLIRQWMEEQVDVQASNARADVGFLVTQRAGVGPANAGRWWAHFWLSDWTELTLGPRNATDDRLDLPIEGLIRTHLSTAVLALRHAGYGDPLPAHHPYPQEKTA